MFTDIEGSTVLLERLREGYATVLEQHRDLLRATFARHDGFEVDTQGDSFFVAFGSAKAAVECAHEIQRSVATHDWPESTQLRVRIGIHTGQPTLAATGYVGVDVHRGARIGAAAHGGQVLLSETTRVEVLDELASDTELVALGVHRFKGLTEPTTVYQLKAPGLETDFPPVRTSAPEDEPPTPGEPPYKGLLRFEAEDAALFFGREELVAEIAEAARTEPFTAVVGASGSGKSSLVRAGVVPALDTDGGLQRVVVFTPTRDPFESLAAAFSAAGEAVGTGDLRARARETPDALNDLTGSASTVLVVDQFEELFTLCRDDGLRSEFVAALMASARGKFHVLITLRADFYAEVAQFPELREAVADHQLYIGPMEPDDLRRAIEEPARRGGWEIAPGLVDLLLRDIGDEPGALPLLSHALLETWRRRRGSRMTLKGYFESGEVRGAIARTADRLYAELPTDEQLVARDILLRLTELGEGAQDTRRRASLDELVPSGADTLSRTKDVLRRLVDARLVTVDEGAAEVAHEALIREWPLLREWLHDDREGLRVQRHVTDAAAEWVALAKEPSLLFRGARLATAREWADAHSRGLSDRERLFLDASMDAEKSDERERAEQQRRELQAAQRAAEAERQRAEAERQRAEDQAAAARRLRRRAFVLAGAVVLAAALGVAAVLFASRANEQAALAQAQTEVALAEQAEAERQRLQANEQRTLAEEQRILAEERQRDAEDQRRLALSKQLAAQANASLEDLDLSLLLSLEALNVADTLEARSSLLTGLLSQPQLEGFLAGQEHAVWSVAFSPDGQMLASGDDAGVILWDVTSAEPIGSPWASAAVKSVTFSPDGQTLASGSSNGTVTLWDVTAGEPRRAPLSGHEGPVWSLVFSPDDRTLASASNDGTLILWDVTTGEPIGAPLIGHTRAVFGAAFSPDGRMLASGGMDGRVILWDTTERQPIGASLTAHEDWVQSVAFSPDGETLASASRDGTTILWNVAQRSQIGAPLLVNEFDFSVDSVAFSPDGQTLAAGGRNATNGAGTVILWEVATGERIGAPLAGRRVGFSSIAFSPDGRTLAAGGGLGTVILWDITRPERIATPLAEVGQAEVLSVAVSPDGRTLASGGGDGTVIWRDISTGQPIGPQLGGHESAVLAVAFSPDGRAFASGSDDGMVIVWDGLTGEPIGSPLVGYGHTKFSIAFSPDGRTLASSGGQGSVILWDTDSREPVGGPLEGHDSVWAVASVAFSPDGRTLASGGGDSSLGFGTIVLWDLVTQEPLGPPLVDHEGGILSIAFSPDGRTLASSGYDGRVILWNVETGEPIGAPLAGHAAEINSVAFSPDGSTLASGSNDGMVILWDVAAGEAIGTPLAGHDGPVSSVAFGPGGRTLVSGSTNGTILVWDVDLESWMRTACQVAGRGLTQSEWKHYLGEEEYRPTCSEP